MSGVEDRPRQLVIRTERDDGDQVRLSVQDAGVGLRPGERGPALRAFYTTKSDGHGDRPVRQPLDHREPSRPAVGRRRMTVRAPRSPFPFREAEHVTGVRASWRHSAPATTDAAHVVRKS